LCARDDGRQSSIAPFLPQVLNFELITMFLSTLALVATILSSVNAQNAFAGAVGFGAIATGGNTGTTYHVTTLADSGTGSFVSCNSRRCIRVVPKDDLDASILCDRDIIIVAEVNFENSEMAFKCRIRGSNACLPGQP